MKKLYILALVMITLLLNSCDNKKHTKLTADKVFTNGKVYTVNELQPWAEAVAIKDNKIVFVGSTSDAKAFVGEGTEPTDLEGKMMLPGFVSGHDHIIAANWISEGVSLHTAKSKQEVLDRIAKYVADHPEEKFIRGSGWNTAMFDGGYPTAADLDPIVSDRPAFLIDVTGHEGWLNSLAMERGNISKDSQDILPGTTFWIRDNAGNPTGVGIEFQWTATFVEQGVWDPENMIPSSLNNLHKIATQNGMTAFLSPGAATPNIADNKRGLEDYKTILEILNNMDVKGELKLRSVLLPWFKSPDANAVETSELAAKLMAKYSGDMVKTIGVKIHPESGWFGRGAPMLDNYKGTDAKGSFGVSPERSKELVLEANKRGLDVVIHVEGDASMRAAIDAFEASIKAGYTDARNSLHHIVLMHPDDYKRIIDLDIAVNVTPQFTTSWSDQKTLGNEILGESLINERFGLYGNLAHDGANISLSADYPSTPAHMMGPLYQIEIAVTLTDPSDPNAEPFPTGRKTMTLEQGIKAVTINGAWLLRMEDKIGSIEVGKYADLVVLEKNLFDVEPNKIADVKVLSTMLNGEYTYQAK